MKTTLKNLLGFSALAGMGLFASQALAEMDPSLFDGMKARAIGPAGMSGRLAAVDALESDPNIIYVGSASGGVWKSDDGGLTWTPIFDDQPVASIGALTINQSNPDIIWVGTGEGNPRNSTSVGNGVYKSIDGGKTWSFLGLEESERINTITLHPTDPDIAYVAAMGQLWGENEERGVFKTTDGGETWEKILYVDEKTGATHVTMDPTNPDKLFAAMWQFRRWPYHFKSGGPGSSLFRSYDGGETWQEITPEDGLPEGEWGRANFAIAPSNPDMVYVLLEAEKSVVARSEDGGVTWKVVNDEPNIAIRPFYYTELLVDPKNPYRVYNVESRVRYSIDGGKSFEYFDVIDCCSAPNQIHIDTHTMWIDPNDPRHMMVGNDGGIAISYDMGETWRHVDNLPLAQFYHINVDDDNPYHVYGGLQDNGSWRGPSEVWENGGIRNFHWQEVLFGDGFDTVPDPDNSLEGYAMFQGGYLARWDMETGETRLIRPQPPNEDVELRFNWSAGIAQDPFDSDTVYYGSQFVHKSTDNGLTWEIISDDLTTNNPEWQTFLESGGLTPDVTAAENYTSIVAIAPSPVEEGVIWVGTDDGRVHITRDGGETWESIEDRARRAPDNPWVPHIEPSPHDPSVAFVVFDDHRNGDMETYVYRVENYGRSWTNIATDEISGYAHSIQQDPEDPDLLFLGTEFGLHVSHDGGDSWYKWTAGVPTVSVRDIAIQERESDLVLGTHGRAIYVIDDYSGLRNLDEEAFEDRFRLLSLTEGVEYYSKQSPSVRFDGSTGFRAPNEPRGVMITFLASGDDLAHPDPQQERARKIAKRTSDGENGEENGGDGKITVEVRNSDGELIRTFKENVHQGINRIVWGMQRDGSKPFPTGQQRQDDTLPPGPEVPPGTYELTLKFDGEEVTAQANVLGDPRVDISMEDRVANYEAQIEINEMFTTVSNALERMFNARDDIKALKDMAAKAKKEAGEMEGEEGDEENPYDTFIEKADAILESIDDLEKQFWTPQDTVGIVDTTYKITSKIGNAGFYVGSTYDAPTEAAKTQIEFARNALNEGLAELNALIEEDISALRSQAEELELGLLKSVEPVDAS